jgi:hypothetical protein
VLVQVADFRLLQRPHADGCPVDDEVREQVMTGEHAGDGFDVDGERDDQVGLALVRELDALVTDRVRLDRVMVVEHGERLSALFQRSSLVALGQLSERQRPALGAQLVQRGVGQPRVVGKDALGVDAIVRAGALVNVDAGGTPTRGGLAQRQPARRFHDGGEVGDAPGGQLACDVVAAELCETHRLEAPPIADAALAASQPELDAVALVAPRRLAGSDPDGRHQTGSLPCSCSGWPCTSAHGRRLRFCPGVHKLRLGQ